MTHDEIKQKMYDKVANTHKKLKPGDVAKSIAEEAGIDKAEAKKILAELVNEGKLVYTYFGSSFIELPSLGDK